MGKNGGQGLGNIGARLEGLLKRIGNWRSIGELGETGKLQTGARLEGLLKQKLASIFIYYSYHIIGQNKIKTGQTGTRHITSYAVGMGVILRVHLLTLSRLGRKSQ